MGRNPPPLPVARRPEGYAPTSRTYFFRRHEWEYAPLPWWLALFSFTRRCKACGTIEGTSEGLACRGEMQSNLPIPFGTDETE